MNKILTIIGLILILNIVAADPSITNLIIPSEGYYGDNIDINFYIDTNQQTGTINLWDNETIIDQQNFDENTNNIYFTKNWTTLGLRTIKGSLSNLSGTDTNNLNNIIDKNIIIKEGIDFYITSLTTNPTTLMPGQNIEIVANVTNQGDTDFLGTSNIKFYYNGTEIGENTFEELSKDSTKNIFFSYQVPEDFTGTATIIAQVNPINAIPEYNFLNNTTTANVTETQGTNLKINNVNVNNQPTIGKMSTFEIIVENTGGLIANNITIGVYKNIISNETKIGDYQIESINGNTSHQIDFTTFFSQTGSNKIYFFVDPLNSISEFNENDNDFILDINIADSNYVMNLGEYLSVVEVLENELNSCQSDLKSSRLERDIALDSVANLTTERNNCESNLNSCNQNNATFLSNWVEGRDNDFAEIEKSYMSQLAVKDDLLDREKSFCITKLTAKEDEALLVKALLIIIIVFIIIFKIVPLFKKPKNMIMRGDV